MTLVYVVVALVLGLGLLVLVHEWGHFVMARAAGVRVETFSIGFGRTVVSRERGATTYKIGWLPLGGYVKMAGEDPAEPAAANDPGAYASKPVRKRLLIVLAGPIMNILLAAVIMPVTFLIGRERPAYEVVPPVIEEVRPASSAERSGILPGDRILAVEGRAVATWEDVQEQLVLSGRDATLTLTVEREGTPKTVKLRPSPWGLGFHPATFLGNQPIVDEVTAAGPAARAGVMAGDRVVTVAGQPIRYWDQLTLAVMKGRSLWFWLWAGRMWQGDFGVTADYVRGGPLPITIQRGGARLQFLLEPAYDEGYERQVIGVRHDPEAAYAAMPKVMRRYPLMESIVRGEAELWRLFRLTAEFLYRLVNAPEQHYESLGGPIRIISMFAKIAQEGLSPFLYFLAFFSLQLGFLNLLPVPVLDGGHVVFLTIEALRGRPLALRVQSIAQHVGLAMLLTLFAIVTYNDLDHFELVRRLFAKLF
ncbi:MAG: RIP metalloprotease RseP [Deltaproteobacteria bacterium]|nr:RIP metalloprotease RseP [Deltaproteobacteria bacterium]